MKANTPSKLDAEFAAAFHELGGATHTTFTTNGTGAKAYDIPPEESCPWERYFYHGKGYFKDVGNLYVPLNCRSIERHLIADGVSPEKPKGGISDIGEALNLIEVENYVQYAGPFAGADRGLMQFGDGRKILVTESPRVPVSSDGEWENLRAVIEGLIADPDERQLASFHGWVKSSYLSLQKRKYRPCPVLALCGPIRGGKSLLVDILTQILGGRQATAHQWLSGKKEFNLACVGAELLTIDDKCGSTDPRARETLSQNIKSALFSGMVSIEGKHQNSFDCRPWWRIVIALNDDPESMLVLPPITSDVADKISLIKCRRIAFPMAVDTEEQKEFLFRTLVSEIPAYIHWLTTSFQIPEDLRDERCGVAAYRHPDLSAALQSLSPEEQLKAYLVDAIRGNFIQTPIKMPAVEIQHIVCSDDAIDRHAARGLLKWHGACGQYMARLAAEYPHWIERGGKLDGVERWLIKTDSPDHR
jgi:hypothetical protein